MRIPQPQIDMELSNEIDAAFAPSAPVASTGIRKQSTCSQFVTRQYRIKQSRSMHMAVEYVDFGKQAIDFLNTSPMVVPTLNEISSAFAGGTVGAMGTLIALELSKQREIEKQQCPYCRGTGKLPCGQCYGLGATPEPILGEVECECCHSHGAVECNHCEGSGRLLPIRYERALRQSHEEYYFGSIDDNYYKDKPSPFD
eukprot:CAMPEP_0184692434 /NCGR_PEP_ID=MMETSP0313-20130426/920_1 /TAXON_ID=2792 /ORGANISM="Porphyridium aerugineum, Strain SAG 1380-2" /LENGTH=198 /DNA_ID=CAMNT_0027150267 /DNA_START=63 /DNA_END=659 /DNA_ORIENTATION=+